MRKHTPGFRSAEGPLQNRTALRVSVSDPTSRDCDSRRDGVERHASTLVAEQSAHRGARNASTIGRAGSMNPHDNTASAETAKLSGLQWQARLPSCAVPVAITHIASRVASRAIPVAGRGDRKSSPMNAGGPRRDRRGETRALRGRAARSARLAHNQEVAGSNPALATRSAADEKLHHS